MLAEELCKEALPLAAGLSVADVRVGLGYTAVALDDGRCGLAFTLHEKEYESCTVIAEAGALVGRKASELAAWMQQSDETACSIGLATVNALIGVPRDAIESDILDLLQVGSRRWFLQTGLAGLAGLTLADTLRAQADTAGAVSGSLGEVRRVRGRARPPEPGARARRSTVAVVPSGPISTPVATRSAAGASSP